MTKKSELAIRVSGAIVMSGFMSTALSGVFTYLEFGLSISWLENWGRSILIAWPIALGLDLALGSKIRHLSLALVGSSSHE